MLSKLDIGIDRLPKAGQEVLVRTWPAGTSKLFALRYLELRALDGSLLAGALYEYLVVDIEARRPLRPEKILDPGLKGDYPPPRDDLSPGLQGDPGFSLEALEAFKPALALSASPRHLDYNGHVNNAHIIDWLADAVPPSGRGSGEIARLKVDFIAELRAGDQVEASIRHADASLPEWRILLARGGEPVAKAYIAWRPSVQDPSASLT
jgi:acyl-ACP thioesterase